MKSIKVFVLAMVMVMSNVAVAGTASETAAGMVLGAVAGRAICHNCNSRHQNIATGAGVVAGGLMGYSMGDRQDRREAIQTPRGGFNDGVNNTRTVRNVNPVQNQPVASEWVEQTSYNEPARTRVRQPVRETGCDEQYYRGSYNPEAAQAYCQGRRERERQVREAYAEGLAGR